MKTKILVLVIAAALLVSFGSKFSGQTKAEAQVASANSTIGGIAEDSK
jgi:hypothetical protein